MDLSAYAAHAVRLANAVADGEEPGDGEGGNIDSLDGLRSLLTALDFPDIRATRSDLDALRRLRIEFREIFSACAAGNGAGAVDRVNALLIQHPVHPQISSRGERGWVMRLTEGGSVADRYAATSAMGLGMAITELGTDRLGVCGSASCQRVFLDESPAPARRHCSQACASGTNVTAFRARRKAEASDVLPTAAV